jgi:hypothetical protein
MPSASPTACSCSGATAAAAAQRLPCMPRCDRDSPACRQHPALGSHVTGTAMADSSLTAARCSRPECRQRGHQAGGSVITTPTPHPPAAMPTHKIEHGGVGPAASFLCREVRGIVILFLLLAHLALRPGDAGEGNHAAPAPHCSSMDAGACQPRRQLEAARTAAGDQPVSMGHTTSSSPGSPHGPPYGEEQHGHAK